MPKDDVWMLALVGGLVIAAVLTRRLSDLLKLPAIVGYMLIGLGIGVADARWSFLSEPDRFSFAFLADAGIVVLLFRVGLESNFTRLMAQIRRASFVWVGDFVVSFAVAYGVASQVLGYGLVPSLVAASALSATSLGVAAAFWRDRGALKTDRGALLTDIAELDDLSGILALAVMLAVLPRLLDGGTVGPEVIGEVTLVLLVKFFAFCAFCFLFARYLERPITGWFRATQPRPTVIIVVLGLCFAISTLADFMGFSLAVGALFAGLAFSRDPAEHSIDKGFEYLFLLFSPFFFIHLGMVADPSLWIEGLAVGGVLAVAAIVGKLVGVGGATWMVADRKTAILIGISMIPRAEITLVILQQAAALGPAAVPGELFGGMIFVSILTCLLVPFALQLAFRRHGA